MYRNLVEPLIWAGFAPDQWKTKGAPVHNEKRAESHFKAALLENPSFSVDHSVAPEPFLESQNGKCTESYQSQNLSLNSEESHFRLTPRSTGARSGAHLTGPSFYSDPARKSTSGNRSALVGGPVGRTRGAKSCDAAGAVRRIDKNPRSLSATGVSTFVPARHPARGRSLVRS